MFRPNISPQLLPATAAGRGGGGQPIPDLPPPPERQQAAQPRLGHRDQQHGGRENRASQRNHK